MEVWSLNNGIYLRYSCHKNLDKLREKLRNIYSKACGKKLNNENSRPSKCGDRIPQNNHFI